MHFSESRGQFLNTVQDALRRYDSQLKEINYKIWSNPELAYAEHQAHDHICELFESLQAEGYGDYTVHRQVYSLDTAFEVEYTHGKGGHIVIFNAEYDALPGIGHACGHNLIATSSIAAFIATCEAMKAHAQSMAGSGFTLRLLGTPAEESGGGKVHLLNKGAYKGVDACLMVHPIPLIPAAPTLQGMATVVEGGFLANHKVKVTFTGRSAHAAAAPWEGVNALDAVVAAYLNVSLLRQQILPSQRVHGVIVNGGERPNIIPASATLDYYIRSPTVSSLEDLKEKVLRCFEAAATATGCTLEYNWGPSYADLKTNMPICESYVAAMQAMGHHTVLDDSGQKNALGGGSTDMGNVSYAVPGFHGLFTIPTEGVNHTPQFTSGAGSSESFQRALACAAGMAVVACQILIDDKFAGDVKRYFDEH
ncbi:uncharacterized protein N7515_005126 [Penicillium bovifimosum]|uniref:Peptidase M20 domain-containing protein 2 n=1 Tax=Penicillium bovifimosum TaxID=126998 RepID=A0A9W9H305_9EURO|nr:uncharacterized protein N7515_005126 [Penicillium bovifimosum]KAJ5135848.1 hypothetical protein N7515_005126 [Penicillium bovifimosum]